MSPTRLSPLNIPTLLGRIVLAMAVLMSSLAWMPSTAQAAPEAQTSAAPKVEAWILGSRLCIDASRLPRQHVFNIRARRGSSSSWTKVGSSRSTRLGEMNKSVRLTGTLMRSFRLQVCLKDKQTDRLYCARARRIY